MGIVGLLFCWFIIHLIVITIDGFNDKIQKADVAVVLGNKVYEQGPSKRLQGRLDRAVEIYQQKMVDKIVVSGGIEPEGFNEAIIMKDYLMRQAVLEEDIILDQNGYNTYLTALNTKELSKRYGFKSVLLISQFYHMTRIKLAFKKVGFEEIYSAHAKYFEWRDLYSLIREFFAYYQYLLY